MARTARRSRAGTDATESTDDEVLRTLVDLRGRPQLGDAALRQRLLGADPGELHPASSAADGSVPAAALEAVASGYYARGQRKAPPRLKRSVEAELRALGYLE